MAQDNQLGSKVPGSYKASNASGANLNPGPYEAEVVNVLDTTRAGRLQVWIPDIGGGDKADPKNWYTLSYASPYAGMTSMPEENSKNTTNNYQNTRHTYGFWGNPPDVGNIVLCTFINGDPGRGYWFACTIDKLGKGMVPGIAGGPKDKMDVDNLVDASLSNSLTDESVWPLAEFQENQGINVSGQFMSVKKPPHEFQTKRYIAQGLDRDPLRGANSSSVQRDVPSSVFGISSPGRKLVGDTADNPDLQSKIASGNVTEKDLYTIARKGGHTFVMDDGDFFGKNQLMRFRTTMGHEILMDDTDQMMYIINSEGSCWIELAGNGQMHIFTSSGFNVRSQGDINLHSDTSIRMHAGDSISMFAKNNIDINSQNYNQTSSSATVIYGATVQVGSSGALNLSADGVGSFKAGSTLQLTGSPLHLNTSTGPTVQQPTAIPQQVHDDTQLDGGTKLWTVQPGILNSIVTIAPTHEPWKREGGTDSASAVSGS